jgi:hypothetical protein
MNYDTVYYNAVGVVSSVQMPRVYVDVTPKHQVRPLRGFRVVCAVFLDDVCVGWTVTCLWHECGRSVPEGRAVKSGELLCDDHLAHLMVTGNAFLKPLGEGSTTNTLQNSDCGVDHNSGGPSKNGPIPSKTSRDSPMGDGGT